MIPGTNNRNNYTGDASTDTYSYTFKIFDETHLVVKQRDTADLVTLLTLNVDYTVTGVSNVGGGTIVLTAGNLGTDIALLIRRVLPLTQDTDIRNQGPNLPENQEDEFDRGVMISQQQQDELDRCFKLDDTSSGIVVIIAAPEAGKFLGWNGTATALINIDPGSVALATPASESIIADMINSAGIVATLLKLNGVSKTGGTMDADPTVALGVATKQYADLSRENAIINGSGIINQRGDYTLIKDAYDFGACDRFEGMATGTAVSAGVLAQTIAASIGIAGFAHKFSGVTLTGTGILYHRTRIESKDAKHYKNQTASFGVKVYHDVGSAITYTITVRKADVEDDFSATTEISNDGGTSVVSATATPLGYEAISMGDCSNGIEVEVKIECGTITTKNFELTDYKLELGTVATDFRERPISEESALSRYYFQRINSEDNSNVFGAGFADTATVGTVILYFAEKRDVPAISISNISHFDVLIGGGLSPDITVLDATGNTISKNMTGLRATVAAGLTAGGAIMLRAFSASGYIDIDAELS